MYALRVNVDLSPVEVWVAHTNADEYGRSGNDKFQATKVGAEFKTGPFGLMGQYETVDFETTGGVDDRRAGDYMMLTGTYRMGANTFMLGYGQLDAEADDRDMQWIAIGMRHAFSRQASVHVGARQTKWEDGSDEQQ
jgi:putative NIF3 family GTP cyclohydrolase 1 type 2